MREPGNHYHQMKQEKMTEIVSKTTAIVSTTVTKTKNRLRALLLLIPVVPAMLAVALTLSGFTKAQTIERRQSIQPAIEVIPSSDLPAVPLPVNEHVQRELDRLTTGNGRYTVEKWLSRSKKYLPMMRQVFAEERVPQELIYLSMIESGLNPVIASGAKAVGLWQFIESTGGMYGLRVNSYFDNRRDPISATRAAARHLRDLYNEMGDWHLALSTYNCSMAAIKRAMARLNQTTYWGIRRAIPQETRDYVPRYIAATIIASNPEKYGFTNILYEEPVPFDTVRVKGSFDLNTIGQSVGVSGLEIKVLNPELLQAKTPPASLAASQGYLLYIPAGSAEKFYANFAKAEAPSRLASADRFEEARMMAGL
jgi:membrane-bound lytic murein transglycosylase D